jgi:hypothetical protein
MAMEMSASPIPVAVVVGKANGAAAPTASVMERMLGAHDSVSVQQTTKGCLQEVCNNFSKQPHLLLGYICTEKKEKPFCLSLY